jgi:hypothetical protein
VRGLRFALALVLMSTGVVALPTATHAECLGPLPSQDVRDYVGVAFTATVVEVSDETDPPLPGNTPFNTKVVLDVDRVYRGWVEDLQHWNEWDAGCSWLRPHSLKEGQELFISADRLDPKRKRSPGFLLIWRQHDDGWRFFSKALSYAGPPPDYYPPEARAATTTRQIRDLVGVLNHGWLDPVPRPVTDIPAEVRLLRRILHRFGDHVEALVEGLRRLTAGPPSPPRGVGF